MAFSSSIDGTAPSPQPALRVTDDTHFYLEDEFYFILPEYANTDFRVRTNPLTHVVLPGPTRVIRVLPRDTDLASVPKILWGLMASYGRQTLPALLHDQLCDEANAKRDHPGTPRADAFADRCFADNMFRHGLRAVGMDAMRRWTFWAGVCFGRYLNFNKVIAVVLGVYTLFLSTLLYAGLVGVVWALAWKISVSAKIGAITGPDWPVDLNLWQLALAGLVTMVLPIVLSLVVWRHRLWAVLWVGAYVGLPVVLLLVVGWMVLYWTRRVPWRIQRELNRLPFVDLDPGPKPPLTPTGLRPM